MLPWRRIAALLILVASAGGCRTMWPDWFQPGPIDYQRQRAAVHDPYPDNDLGPQVVGGRPREFQKPAAEPVRNRALTDSVWQGYRP